VLVVAAVVAMVPLSALVNRHGRIFGNWRRKRAVPSAAVLKVVALGEGAAEPVDEPEGEANPTSDPDAQE
jgi:hypothetical protein